ncbi:MAG: hypothetical protein WCW77_00615 [Patescibacteria group bacterium]|jgi:Zn finger protein HypA/HybF involved in hydrogenase expression
MIKIYKILKTNELIAVDLETNEVLKMVEVNSEGQEAAIGGGITKPEEKEVISPRKFKKRSLKPVKIKKEKPKEKNKKCRDCGEEPAKGRYLSGGLCPKCYARNQYRKKAKQKSESKKKESDILNYDPEKTSAVNSYSCNDCYHDFKSVFELIDTKCPECGSVHVSLKE